jgi:spermidine export protein MdtI
MQARPSGGSMHMALQWGHWAALGGAIALGLVSDICIQLSQGFEKRLFAIASILAILGGFTCLSYAARGIGLSVAYAAWGGLGMVLTALAAQVLFGQRLRGCAWIGMAFLVLGLVLLEAA